MMRDTITTTTNNTQQHQKKNCLVQLKIARDAPLLEFAILAWTIPAPVVQVYIAISAIGASGRVERLQRAAQDPKAAVPAGCATKLSSHESRGSALGRVEQDNPSRLVCLCARWYI